MRRRALAFALLLALCLTGAASAEADWAGETARTLSQRLIALAGDEGYVAMFTTPRARAFRRRWPAWPPTRGARSFPSGAFSRAGTR